MAVVSAAGRYKRIRQNPSVGKEAAPKIDGRTKALGAPYDYQRLKRFNAQQALENPDWRNRSSDNTSSGMDDGEQNIRELMGIGKQWTAASTSTAAVESQRQAEARQAFEPGQDGTVMNSSLRRTKHDVFTLSSEMEPKVMKSLEEEKPVQYEVVRQICLSSSREHPLSLFEVVPLGSMPSCLAPSVVDIRPLRMNLAQRKHEASGNGQDEQLTAALRAAETTPHKVRAHIGRRNHQDEAQKAYAMADEARARKSLAEQHDMSAVQKSKTQVHTNEHQLSYAQTARLVTSEGPVAAAEAGKDEAFQRFLKRLGQKNRGTQEDKTQRRDRVDSGYEDGRGNQGKPPAGPCAAIRYQASAVDVRKKALSDPSNDRYARSAKISHKKEDTSSSTDSGIAPGESAKLGNLNPKAREFMSFVSNRVSSSEDDGTESFATFSAERFAGKDGQANFVPLAAPAMPNGPCLQPPPPYGLMPFVGADAAADPLTLNGLMTGRLASVPTDEFAGQLPASAIPLPPLPSLLPAVFRPQNMWQSMTGNMLGVPPAPPMLNAGFPLTAGSVSPCLGIPSCQIPLAGGAPRPPQPVPKPRRPDPGDQQAYEAWIEWRKANEPGYALECRLRQQRRAQRSMTDKTDKTAPRGPHTSKSEVSVST